MILNNTNVEQILGVGRSGRVVQTGNEDDYLVCAEAVSK